MSEMNSKNILYNTTFSVQLPFCCQKNNTPSSTLHSSFYNRYTRNISYVCKCICITNKIFIKSTELQTNIQKIQKYSLVFLIAIGFHTWKIIIINTIISVVEFLVTNNLVTNNLVTNNLVTNNLVTCQFGN